MIIYIHGFASSGQGGKAKQFREYYQENGESFIAPTLSYVPELAIDTLQQLIENSDDKVSLIGSSLGGYYATYLANMYNLNAVLINPSIVPYQTLQKTLGFMQNYYDQSSFEWRESHLEMLKKYEVKKLNHKNFMLLLQTGDETLDYKQAVAKFSEATLIIEEGGSHGFEGIERHFERVNDFCNADGAFRE